MTRLKKVLATGGVVLALTVISACSNDTPEGPFVTPTPDSQVETKPEGTVELNENPEIPSDPTPADPTTVDAVDLLPFQYDLSNVQHDETAAEHWDEELIEKAPLQGLTFLETAYHLSNVWTEGERTLQDFEALREGVTPEVWNLFEYYTESDEHPGSLLNLVLFSDAEGVVVRDSEGNAFTPDPTPPVNSLVSGVRMTVVVDEEWFGTLEPRYELGGTFTHQFFGENEAGERKTATYKRDAFIYLIPIDGEWKVDGWYSTDMEIVE